jgi:hypothetical protein
MSKQKEEISTSIGVSDVYRGDASSSTPKHAGFPVKASIARELQARKRRIKKRLA